MKKFKQFINEQEKKKKAGAGEYGTDELVKTYIKDTPGQTLDEASIEQVVKFFVDFHLKNKNKKIDRNIWTVSRMAGMRYGQLEDALAKQAVRGLLPKKVKTDLEQILGGRQRRQQTMQKLGYVY